MDPLLIEIPDEVETDRLILRAPQPDDAPEINRAILASIEQLKPWMPWADPAPELDETEHYCRRSAARFLLREALDFRIHLKSSGVFVGSIGLQNIQWKIPRFEIGYWLHSSHTGQGYMTEAVKTIAWLAFTELQAVRVAIDTDSLNHRSCRVAERAGFVLEGTLHNHQRRLDGSLRDTCIYGKIP
jgi:ribosomal-protein-serine acetyltransferase